jgi:predicted RecA/RadA family phage recombinase
MLYVALYGSGEIAKINTATKKVVSLLKVGSKPKAMALTSDGSRLLVTRFISDKDYAEVYDINTAGNMSFRDEEQPSIRINKVRVPDDINHGSGVPNYLRSIVIGPNDDVAYVTANKANIDRGEFLNGQALDDDNTIRPMIAILNLINHEDSNIDPNSRANTIDLDNSADPSGITFLPDGVTRAHALQGNNVVEFHNLAQNTSLRASSGFAPQSMCTTVRSLYVKNFTDRTVSVINTAGFMYDGRQNPNVQTLVTVEPENEVKTAEELRGLQVFYHARVPDISPEGYMSCASCHDDGGHDGMTWDLTHMGEGLRNTLSLRGTSGTRFGNLHWSSNFDEVQDFEVQLEHLSGAEGLIPGQTFTDLVSPTSYTTAGASDDLDALAAYVTSLGKSSVLRSPNSCSWGGRCSQNSHNGAWQFIAYGCVDCHTGAAFRDGENHDVGTIAPSSGQRLGSPLTEIRTPTLIELWDTAPYFHDGSAATLEEVMSRGDHAEMGLDEREQRNLIQYLLNLDRLDYIDDEEDEPVPVDSAAPVISISGYEVGETVNAQVDSSFTLPSATAVDGVDGDVDVSVSSDFDIGVANTYNVTYSATDNAGNEVTVTLTIVVNAAVMNTPPVAADDQFTANIDEVLVLPFSSILDNDTDIDGDSLTILIVDDWSGGVASLDSVARTITFTPDAGFSGVAQFNYALTDGNDGGDYGLMGFSLVLIDVGGGAPSLDTIAPVITIAGHASGDTSNMIVGQVFVEPRATAEDNVDGVVNVTSVSNVDTTAAGTYSVIYSAVDSAGNAANATVNVVVAESVGNTPPTITINNYTEDGIELTIGEAFISPSVTATDTEDGDLAVTSSGTVDINLAGTYTLTYSATNTGGVTVTAFFTVVVIVPSSNTPPEAQNSLFKVRINETIEISFGKITVNDVDADNDPLLIASVDTVENGEVIFDSAAKTITFTPAANFIGEASFGYTITDGQNNSSAIVTILVTSEPVISIAGYTTGDTAYLAVGDTFTLPEVTALDVEDGVRTVTSSGAVNTAVEGLYVLSYTATDTEGYVGTANLIVVVDGVGGEPVPQSSVRQFTFNHSLWQHDESSNAVTGYWVGEFATASQTSYAWNGQFGQLDYHGIGDGVNLDVGPSPNLGSANSTDVFPSVNTHFRDVYIDNVIIMPSNFDQRTAPLVDSGLISAAQRVVDYVVDEGTYGGQHSESMVYIYEHWQEASAAFPLTESEWTEYHTTTTQGYHQWFLNYQYQLMASRPEIDFRMIPVGPIIADILQNNSLQASGFTFSELYDDGAPHGKPEIYFLAGLITYQAMYGQMASNSYVPPVSNISPLIASEFPELNAFIWERLNHYNANGVRIWP